MTFTLLKAEDGQYYISRGGLFDPLIGPFASKKDAEEARAALEADELVLRWLERRRRVYEEILDWQIQAEREAFLLAWLKDKEEMRQRMLEFIAHLLIKPEELAPDDDGGFSPGM